MTRTVVVTLALSHDQLNVSSRVGAHGGPDFCFAVPSPHFWDGEEGRAFILETFALLHFPIIDSLAFEVPAAHVEEWRERLVQNYTGKHVVRDTECRSQQLTVTVRHVQVAAGPAAV